MTTSAPTQRRETDNDADVTAYESTTSVPTSPASSQRAVASGSGPETKRASKPAAAATATAAGSPSIQKQIGEAAPRARRSSPARVRQRRRWPKPICLPAVVRNAIVAIAASGELAADRSNRVDHPIDVGVRHRRVERQ